jgi:predicted RNA-binding protein with RPS1 domain
VRVKVLEADEKGRVRLSMKAAAEDAQKAAAAASAPAEAPATPAA